MKKNSKIKLTQEEIDKIVNALGASWNAIANDAFINDDGERDTSIIFRRSQVAEIAADANRMSTFGGLSHELEDKFYNLSPSAQKRIIKLAFPSERYGY